MLSRKDKEEFIRDGFNLKRRASFAKAKICAGPVSTQRYIRFLMDIQKVFPFTISRKKTATSLNKL
jgi:hypothetical protein